MEEWEVKTIYKLLFVLILSILFNKSTWSQNNGSISGIVKDKKTGELIFSANVYLKGLI